MKKLSLLIVGAAALALTGGALAADMAPVYKAPLLSPVSAYNWGGFYIGAHIGTGWGTKTWNDSDDISDNTVYSTTGFLGGGQIGYNFLNGPWVYGIEGDISWTNMRGAGGLPNEGFNADGVKVEPANMSTKMHWIATLTGRLGFANGPWLFYGKGGFAWARETHKLQEFEFDGENFDSQSARLTRSGWTAGVGVEYAFYQAWTAKIEYNYLDFGTKKVDFPNLQDDLGNTTVDQQIHVVKVGLNYRLGSWPGP